MLIDCPDCATQYDVPDARLRPNLRLRCGRCATEWVAQPSVVAEVVADPAPRRALVEDTDEFSPPDRPVPSFLTPGPRPMPPREIVRARSKPPYGLVAAWLLSLVILGGAGWAAVIWRAPIMHTWPPASRAYAAIGLLDRPPAPASAD